MAYNLKPVAFVTACMLAWSAFGPAAGIKLCLAPHGHVAVESMTDGPCVAHEPHSDSAPSRLVDPSKGICAYAGCFDIPLGSGLDSATVNQSAGIRAIKAWYSTAMLSPKSATPLSYAAPDTVTPQPPSDTAALRTVRLLI